MQRLVGVPIVLGIVGCGNSPIGPQICERPATDEPVKVCIGQVSGKTFTSQKRSGELLAYNGGAFYRMYHGLGVVPNLPRVYLSFSRYGEGSLSPAAGNQFELKEINSEYIEFLKGTCDDGTFVLVQTESPEVATDPAIQGDLGGCLDLGRRLRGEGGAD